MRSALRSGGEGGILLASFVKLLIIGYLVRGMITVVIPL